MAHPTPLGSVAAEWPRNRNAHEERCAVGVSTVATAAHLPDRRVPKRRWARGGGGWCVNGAACGQAAEAPVRRGASGPSIGLLHRLSTGADMRGCHQPIARVRRGVRERGH